MITYRASLDVSRPTLAWVTGLVVRARRAHPGARPWQRAVSAAKQALLVLRWLRDATPMWRLAYDTKISLATAYRYRDEVLDVLAAQAPTLEEAIEAAIAAGVAYVMLDGTLIPTDRVAARKADGKHVYYSGKHKQFGVNVQVLTDPTGYPLWTSQGCPGSTHDLAAARELVIWRLDPYTSRHWDLPLDVLTDKGYVGAGAGYLTPTKKVPGQHPEANPGAATRNELITALRASAERANALLKQRWHALDKIHCDPELVATIVAALALTHREGRGNPCAAQTITIPSENTSICSYAVTTIHQSNQMYKYHLFDTAIETVGPSFTGGATGVATYTQKNTVVNCTDAESTTWFSVTKGYVVVGGRTYESTVTSKDVSLACGT